MSAKQALKEGTIIFVLAAAFFGFIYLMYTLSKPDREALEKSRARTAEHIEVFQGRSPNVMTALQLQEVIEELRLINVRLSYIIEQTEARHVEAE